MRQEGELRQPTADILLDTIGMQLKAFQLQPFRLMIRIYIYKKESPAGWSERWRRIGSNAEGFKR